MGFWFTGEWAPSELGQFGDADGALKDAREIGHAATLMFALNEASYTRPSTRSPPE